MHLVLGFTLISSVVLVIEPKLWCDVALTGYRNTPPKDTLHP